MPWLDFQEVFCPGFCLSSQTDLVLLNHLTFPMHFLDSTFMLSHLTNQCYFNVALDQFSNGVAMICPSWYTNRIKCKVFRISQARVRTINSQLLQRICPNIVFRNLIIHEPGFHLHQTMPLKGTLNPMLSLLTKTPCCQTTKCTLSQPILPTHFQGVSTYPSSVTFHFPVAHLFPESHQVPLTLIISP